MSKKERAEDNLQCVFVASWGQQEWAGQLGYSICGSELQSRAGRDLYTPAALLSSTHDCDGLPLAQQNGNH